MPGIISDAQANAIIDLLFGSTGSTYHAALMTVSPAGDGTGGTEVSGGSYARVSFTDNSTTWPAAASRQKKNGVAFTFPTPTADWGTTIVGLAIYTASSGGTFKGYFRFTNTVTILNGYPAPVIAINSLTVSEANI